MEMLIDYVIEVGTYLLLPMALIPTVEEVKNSRSSKIQVAGTEVGPISELWWQDNMVYSERNVREGRWWTIFSHSLVHLNKSHKVSNMLVIFPGSVQVYANFGLLGVLGIFHGSSMIVATRMFRTVSEVEFERKFYNKSSVETLHAEHEEGYQKLVGWGKRNAGSWWNRGMKAIATSMSPVVYEMSEYVGASQGCFALVGAGFLIASLESVRLAYDLVFGRHKPPVKQRKFKSYKRRSSKLLALCCELSVVQHSVGMIWNEGKAVFLGTGDLGISSSSHLTGFVFGVGVCSALLVSKELYGFTVRRKVSKPSR